jgi:hypothetical protein
MANEIDLWTEICWMHDFDLSEAKASLQPQPPPIADLLKQQFDSRAGDAFCKHIMDSQLLVEIFGFAPDEAISAVQNNGQAQTLELVKRKVERIVRKAPEWEAHFTKLVGQFCKKLNDAGYNMPKGELRNRLVGSMTKFAALQIGVAT